MASENETQSIPPESESENMTNEPASVLTKWSLFQPGSFNVTLYAKDLLECDSTTTMAHNTQANRSFAIIESGPSKNLVSYSFSGEEDSALRTVHEDGIKPSQYQYEVSVEEIIIGDTVQSNIKEHDRIDLRTHSNDIVNISKL